MRKITVENQKVMQEARRAALARVSDSTSAETRKELQGGHPGGRQSPSKAIRHKCLDCSTTVKTVKYCPCDGIHSTRCALWPFRFGIRPSGAARKHGPMFLNPKEMPDANTAIEELP